VFAPLGVTVPFSTALVSVMVVAAPVVTTGFSAAAAAAAGAPSSSAPAITTVFHVFLMQPLQSCLTGPPVATRA
jgi:hypothetical protein